MIGLEEMAEAVARWDRFKDAAAPVELEEQVADLRRRLDEGADLREVLAEYIEGEEAKTPASSLYAYARGVGVDAKACLAFIVGMSTQLRDFRHLPVEIAIDGAAFAGLVVGLTARQLAEEES